SLHDALPIFPDHDQLGGDLLLDPMEDHDHIRDALDLSKITDMGDDALVVPGHDTTLAVLKFLAVFGNIDKVGYHLDVPFDPKDLNGAFFQFLGYRGHHIRFVDAEGNGRLE